MKNFTTCICIMGLSGTASAQIMMDYIGAMDGTGIGGNISANQDFEAAFDQYDAVVADSFTAVGGENISQVEMVLGGWNGFIDPSSITGYSANLYSGGAAAAVSLVGDIASQFVDIVDVTQDAGWLGANFLMVVPTGMTAAAGTNWVGVIPSNNFGAGSGQTGSADSLFADGLAGFQANPGGGFGIPGNLQDTTDIAGLPAHAAYRASAGAPPDPCSLPLPTVCPADVDGDGAVAVSDVLAIIGSWGSCGDGTFRPAGDIAPLPNGDCCVTVADVLAVVGSWGADCNVYGACCYGDGLCDDLATAATCAAGGGVYFGDGALCAANVCVAGACCLDLVTCTDATEVACTALLGTYKGDGTACATTDCSLVTPGDECDTAFVAVDGANAFETLTMTPSQPQPDDTMCSTSALAWDNSPDVWFTWTASMTDYYDIDTCDLVSYDTSLVVYSGPCNALVQIACNGDTTNIPTCQDWYSTVRIAAVAGTTYTIRIGGWQAAIGAGNLNINIVPPPLDGACCFPDQSCLDNQNSVSCAGFGGVFAGEGTLCADGVCLAPAGDECADAIVAVVGPNAFDTTLMTPTALPAVDDLLCPGTFLDWGASPDAWLVWTAPATGTASFSACDSLSYDTSMVLYSGSCATLVAEACNGDASGEAGCQGFYSAIYDHPVTAGTNYYVRMGGWQADVGAGTLTITFNDPAGLSACCMPDGTCTEVTVADCATAGGTYYTGSLCIDVTCYAGCPVGGVPEGGVCFVDGDDSATDLNCGLNCVPTPIFQPIAIGVPICGNASVYLDITGATFRDLDWYSNATLNAGGTFTISVGTSGMDLLFGVVDNTLGAFVAAFVLPGGLEGNAVYTALPAGDYSILVGPADWNVAWTCVSGDVDYFVQLD